MNPTSNGRGHDTLRSYEVERKEELSLELKETLYGLKQAGRLR